MTDEKLLSIIVSQCDELDITRVHERQGGGWKSTTIFNGDDALLRVVKAAIDAAKGERK